MTRTFFLIAIILMAAGCRSQLKPRRPYTPPKPSKGEEMKQRETRPRFPLHPVLTDIRFVSPRFDTSYVTFEVNREVTITAKVTTATAEGEPVFKSGWDVLEKPKFSRATLENGKTYCRYAFRIWGDLSQKRGHHLYLAFSVKAEGMWGIALQGQGHLDLKKGQVFWRRPTAK